MSVLNMFDFLRLELFPRAPAVNFDSLLFLRFLQPPILQRTCCEIAFIGTLNFPWNTERIYSVGMRVKVPTQRPGCLQVWPGCVTDVSLWLKRLFPCWISASFQIFSPSSSSVSFSKLFISTFSLHLSSQHRHLSLRLSLRGSILPPFPVFSCPSLES